MPFDREFLSIGYGLQLIERSIANAEFSIQRDVGIQVSGGKIADVFEYRVGVFNGSGGNRNNVDEDYIYTGRLVWYPFGPYPYYQAAVNNPQSPLFAIGVGGAYMPGLEPGERATLAGRLGRTTIVMRSSAHATMRLHVPLEEQAWLLGCKESRGRPGRGESVGSSTHREIGRSR